MLLGWLNSHECHEASVSLHVSLPTVGFECPHDMAGDFPQVWFRRIWILPCLLQRRLRSHILSHSQILLVTPVSSVQCGRGLQKGNTRWWGSVGIILEVGCHTGQIRFWAPNNTKAIHQTKLLRVRYGLCKESGTWNYLLEGKIVEVNGHV